MDHGCSNRGGRGPGRGRGIAPSGIPERSILGRPRLDRYHPFREPACDPERRCREPLPNGPRHLGLRHPGVLGGPMHGGRRPSAQEPADPRYALRTSLRAIVVLSRSPDTTSVGVHPDRECPTVRRRRWDRSTQVVRCVGVLGSSSDRCMRSERRDLRRRWGRSMTSHAEGPMPGRDSALRLPPSPRPSSIDAAKPLRVAIARHPARSSRPVRDPRRAGKPARRCVDGTISQARRRRAQRTFWIDDGVSIDVRSDIAGRPPIFNIYRDPSTGPSPCTSTSPLTSRSSTPARYSRSETSWSADRCGRPGRGCRFSRGAGGGRTR